MFSNTMNKPNNFCMKKFEDFLLEMIPNEHADYIFGLISMAKDREEQDEKWRVILEDA